MSGDEILRNVYDNKDVAAWGMVGVVIAFIVFLRLVHYGIFLYAALPFLNDNSKKMTNGNTVRNTGQNGNAAYELVTKQ